MFPSNKYVNNLLKQRSIDEHIYIVFYFFIYWNIISKLPSILKPSYVRV